MSALQQLQEYRQKQAERFKDTSDDENIDDQHEIQELTRKFEEEEKALREQRDQEYSQNLERNMNFRESYTSDLEENKLPDNYDDIGFEGTPAQVPVHNQHNYMNESAPNYTQNNRETFSRQEPPKWLVQPIHIDRNSEIKVFDFTEGSRNQELRATADSSVNYEHDTMADPSLLNHNERDLELMFHQKQKKRLDKFEELEDLRLEEAKQNGLQIEENKNSVPSEDQNGINAPLLANDPADPPVPQPIGQNNGQARVIVPGLLTRQPNGAFRVC